MSISNYLGNLNTDGDPKVKKLFISQPMKDRTDEQIQQERQESITKAKEILGDNVEVLETVFTDFPSDAKPLEYLARSIEFLAKADVAYFAPQFMEARGCRIEYECAKAYDIEVIEG